MIGTLTALKYAVYTIFTFEIGIFTLPAVLGMLVKCFYLLGFKELVVRCTFMYVQTGLECPREVDYRDTLLHKKQSTVRLQ